MSAEALLKPTARPPANDLPAQIGKYSVRAKLGEGATSEVFLAHDAFHNRDVAIKRVRLGLAADTPEGHFQQHFFAAEAALVGRLQHPNVVQIYDAVDDPASPYLVMEYVPGVTLAPLLPARRAAVAGAGGGNRLQVCDGAGLCLPPRVDPSRCEAGEHHRHDAQRPGHRRQDHRFRQRA